MDGFIRLNYDVERELERARQLRGAYIRRLVRRGRLALSRAIGLSLRHAVHPQRSAAH